jgi:hypothetical protein
LNVTLNDQLIRYDTVFFEIDRKAGAAKMLSVSLEEGSRVY